MIIQIYINVLFSFEKIFLLILVLISIKFIPLKIDL